MQEKYIKLLLNKCISKNSSEVLFIHYKTEARNFVEKLSIEAKKLGIKEIYKDEEDPFKTHEILKNNTILELKKLDYFNKSIWDEYALKNASFIILETEYPNLMNDIEDEKIAYISKRAKETRPHYRRMVEKCQLSWCIAAYPSLSWAKELFKDADDCYSKLENAIYKVCMVDDNPILSWDRQIQKVEKITSKLNILNLTKLRYTNSLGTDLEVFLPNNYLFESAYDRDILVNMPSYEVFISPIYNKTEGIVYSSKILNYNGKIVEDFYLRFKEGKVVDYGAKKGYDILKSIIETDANSCYLGECALVEDNSPISNLDLVFGTTLIDENASCHLALGGGFGECIKDGLNMSDEELLEHGINVSLTHVDFMIGTADLNIIGINKDGKEVSIFKNGNFSPDLLGTER